MAADTARFVPRALRRNRYTPPVFLLSLWLLFLAGNAALARDACTIVAHAETGAVLYQSGPDCDRRFSPASTFKIPLALMGFENGLLGGPDAPAVAYDPALNARYDVWRQTITPRLWLRYSVIWYSQWLTRRTGMAEFQGFVDRIGYGNSDLTGDPGKENGLTHAWLSSSLGISPQEQAAFLSRLRRRELGLAADNYDRLDRTVPDFALPDGSGTVQAKTGTGWLTDSGGNRQREQLGWFVGWMERGTRTLVFVHLSVEDNPPFGAAGSRAKKPVLNRLPDWIITGSGGD